MTSVPAVSHRFFLQKDLEHSYGMTQPLPPGAVWPWVRQESLNFFTQVFSSALQAPNDCFSVPLGEQDE